jgi:hypothetical protein
LAPILLVAAEETSLGCIERLEHEYALKAELDADWAARPVALTHSEAPTISPWASNSSARMPAWIATSSP